MAFWHDSDEKLAYCMAIFSDGVSLWITFGLGVHLVKQKRLLEVLSRKVFSLATVECQDTALLHTALMKKLPISNDVSS